MVIAFREGEGHRHVGDVHQLFSEVARHGRRGKEVLIRTSGERPKS